MIKKIENTHSRAYFVKETKGESWFNHDCSNENLLKQCNREREEIDRVQFMDGDYIGSELMIYFKNNKQC